ncbi:MAG: nitroreductase [Candidatus Marinimicrobia bacterium]|nr:nitroreductase [Candidatus Neomarinimicrobiota bacterium]MBT3632447.1 nitroreductase [Candidatus Neomarinimicrobiota bacterium]MBT3826034.1 nitroreductase [Candidatus Neomarinimicrobiota bacterium]MBT4132270.1 nitroreductase [Candidatus Neomarinimicrobiota bacterium]MBT4296555.1 nitroreductase [Candidatus Neomarinimicrobiota bacterium]
MMDFYDLVKHRESVRDYDPARTIDGVVLNRILNAGRLAPSASNRQPWTFLLVSSPEKLAEIRPCYRQPWFQNAPHVLIIVGDKSRSWVRSYDGYNSIETDLAIVMDHIILAAEYENVGTCWIEAYDPTMLSEAISLKENEVVYSITPLGYQNKGYKKLANKQRKPLEDILKII